MREEIMIKVKSLLTSLAISLGVGVISGIITRNDTKILFNEINKPSFSPPGWLFPVVWTILFILMGISSYIIYESNCPYKNTSLSVYATQLVFNFLWSIIFFSFKELFFASIWIIFLWILILIMIIMFSKCSKKAAFLQIPYLLWVTFAAVLNFAIAAMN